MINFHFNYSSSIKQIVSSVNSVNLTKTNQIWREKNHNELTCALESSENKFGEKWEIFIRLGRMRRSLFQVSFTVFFCIATNISIRLSRPHRKRICLHRINSSLWECWIDWHDEKWPLLNFVLCAKINIWKLVSSFVHSFVYQTDFA